jgi:formate hydrogenlyase subunit 6/NADH:ubiquinone oxidoreductase subunit I
MKVCPTNVIQPTMLEAGLEGLWSPVLNMRMGYCEYKCAMCSQVCPTGAIRPLALEEKQRFRIGLAVIDENSCLPHAFAKTCQACAEHCPLPEKAIWMEETPVINARGNKVFVKQPHVDADLCIGCGICADKCPVPNEGAIRIKSTNETRNLKNRLPKKQ